MPKTAVSENVIAPGHVGMPIKQVIAMLMACEAQGAQYAQLATRMAGDGISTGVDWISPAPVDGVAYIGAMVPFDKWANMDNRALQSLDW